MDENSMNSGQATVHNSLGKTLQAERRAGRRSQVAALLAALLLPAVAAAADHDWPVNAELLLSPGTSLMRGGGAVLLPLYGADANIGFAEVRVTRADDSTDAFNAILGHRLLSVDDTILGGYLAFDRTASRRNHYFNGFGAGLELLSPGWDLRLNYYDPRNSAEVLDDEPVGGRFAGNSLFARYGVEEPLRGYDLEVGALLPFLANETRVYLAGYRYDTDYAAVDPDGYRLELETRPNKRVVVAVAQQEDDLYGSRYSMSLRLQFGLPNEDGHRTQVERMIDFVRREDAIVVTPADEASTERLVTNQAIHIDNTGSGDPGAPRGDGTVENPYDSFESCRQGAAGLGCAVTDSLVYVHAGDGTSGGLDTVQNLNEAGVDSDAPFSLVDGQQLIGQGVSFYGMGGDAYPQLTATGADVIGLANRNEVAGLALTNASGSSGLGIAGNNATDFNIHDNRISTAGGGIDISGSNSDVSGRIDNNVVDSGADGVALANAANAGGSANMTISLSGNTITGADRGLVVDNLADGGSASQEVSLADSGDIAGSVDGIALFNRAEVGGTAEQRYSLAGRDDARVSAALDNAFNADNTAVDDGAATQDLTVAGVAFRAPGSGTPSFADGIDLRNVANGTGMPEAVQTADFSDIAASDGIASVGGDDGVSIANEAFIGRASQSVALAGRGAITGTDLGVGITNAGYGAGQADQDVGVTGFTGVTGGTAGVSADNVSDGGSSAAIQRVALRELTLPAAAGDGLLLANSAANGSTADQAANIADTTVEGVAGAGLRAVNAIDDGTGSAAIQFIDLFTGGAGGGNAVSGSGGAADIVADNTADATTSGDDQRLDLRGNPAIIEGSTIAVDSEGNQAVDGP